MAIVSVAMYVVRCTMCGMTQSMARRTCQTRSKALKSVTSQATYSDPTARWSEQGTERTMFPMCPSFQELTSGFGINPSKHETCSKIPPAAEITVQDAVAADVAASLNRIQELNPEADVADDGMEMAPRPTRSVLDLPNFSAPLGVDEEIAGRGSESQRVKPKTLRTKL